MQAWQATVQDEFGNAITLPVVTVYESDGVTLAEIFNESGVAIDNPLTGSIEGFVQFWAKTGKYLVVGSIGGDTTQEWSVELTGPVSRTRAQAVSEVASGYFLPEEGQTYLIGGLTYVGSVGATAIPDLPGLVPGVHASVKHFGAGVGGDDTGAFSAAALAAIALDTLGPPNNTSTVPRSNTCSVFVPAGEYLLTEVVDVGNDEITWILDPGAKIVGSDFINGRTTRAGLKVTHGHPYGILDSAAGFTATLGGDYSDKPAPVTGVASVAGLSDVAQVDAVALLGTAYSSRALIEAASDVTYTGTTVRITPAVTANQSRRLRRGMTVYTRHSTPFVGVVASWVADGLGITITVQDGWYEYRNPGAGLQVPPNTAGCDVGGVQKIWGANFVTNLTADGYARQAIGAEISNRNLRGASDADIETSNNRVWGYLSASVAEGTAGHYKSQAAFIARGWWHYGFVSDNQDTGIYYKTTGTSGKTGIKTRMPFQGTILDAEDTTNNRRYRIFGTGDVEHGSPAVAAGSGRWIQFHTSGLGSTYDVRLIATGGTSTLGQGQLSVLARRMSIGSSTVDQSAVLDLSNSTLGFLPPRMTTTTRDAIASPTNGLIVWNITTSKLQLRAGGVWVDLN